MMLEGAGVAVTDDGDIPLPLGQTLVLPAESAPVTIRPAGRVTLLDAFLP